MRAGRFGGQRQIVIGGELGQRGSARDGRPSLDGKYLAPLEGNKRRALSRSAVIGFVQRIAELLGIECESNAPVLDLFQLALNLDQARPKCGQ
jgi:hypothetical protein